MINNLEMLNLQIDSFLRFDISTLPSLLSPTEYDRSQGMKWDGKVETLRRHIQGHYQMYIPNFSFLALFGRKIGEERHFFEVKRRGKPHIFHPN